MAEWLTVTDAAIRLGVGTSKISRLLKQRPEIETMENPVDKRAKLVNFDQLKKLFQYESR